MITPTIVLLAGALPLRMAAIFTSNVSELAEKCPLKRLYNYHTCSMIREQAPMLPEGNTLRVQRKRGKVTLSKGADWKKWHNNQQSESGGSTKMEKNWHDNQPQITNMRMRGEERKRKEPGQEKCWKNEATTDPRSTDPSTEQW
jgi:hypothetical protein